MTSSAARLLRAGPAACLVVGLAGCDATARDTAPADDTGEEAPLAPRFSFAVIADPHLTGGADNEARARAAVAWIGENAAARDLAFLVIVGDVSWDVGLATSPGILGGAGLPYVPLIGDNEVDAGWESAFHDTFSPAWADLAARFEDFEQAPVPAWDPEAQVDAWYTNFRFTHQGVTFVALDWAARVEGTLFSEMADLHAAEGGTLPWFESFLDGLGEGPSERICLLSHHPMHLSPGAFDEAEMATLDALTAPHADLLWADLAGHYHADGDERAGDGGYEVHVLDSVHETDITIAVVTVTGNDRRFAWDLERVVLDWEE